MIRAWLLGCALLAALAGSANAQAEAECGAGPFIFDGLSKEPGESTLFDAAWRPRLTALAACLERVELRQACLAVQGQFDDQQFGPEVVRVFGSELAAQAMRGQSRGARMRAELAALGVPARRLIERPAALQPSYRGVAIDLVVDCLPAPAEVPASAPAVPSAPAPPAESFNVSALRGPQQARDIPAPAADAPRLREQQGSGLHVTGEQGLSLFAAHARAIPGAATRIGLRWVAARFYLGGSVGGVFTGELAHDAALESQLSGGYRLLPAIAIGLFASHRVASNSLASAWLEQGLAGGIEGVQCFDELWPGGALCAREAIGLGVGWRRAALEGRQLRVLREQEQDLLVLAGVALLLQHRL